MNKVKQVVVANPTAASIAGAVVTVAGVVAALTTDAPAGLAGPVLVAWEAARVALWVSQNKALIEGE